MIRTARLATENDFRRYHGVEPPSIWLGLILERDGRPVAFGTVLWDENGNALGFFDKKEPLSAFVLHRNAKAMIDVLKAVGERALYVGCDDTVPMAEKWLRRLGFVPERAMTWRVDLN